MKVNEISTNNSAPIRVYASQSPLNIVFLGNTFRAAMRGKTDNTVVLPGF